MPNQGDLVLIPIPYTDLTHAKKRPVIVISNNAYHSANQDIVVVAMTSTQAASPYAISISQADMVAGTLNRPGQIRCDKIYTLAKSIIVKNFGTVSRPVLCRIHELVVKLLEVPAELKQESASASE